MSPRTRLATATLAIGLAGWSAACGLRSKPPEPAPVAVVTPPVIARRPAWDLVRDSVRALAATHQYAEADRILASFSAAHAGAPEAGESEFWRALLLVDPENVDATTRQAMAALDAYLAHGSALPRSLEARAIRELLATSDSLRQAAASARTAADARDKTRVDDLARRQAELDSVRSELDRIKRRLTGRRR